MNRMFRSGVAFSVFFALVTLPLALLAPSAHAAPSEKRPGWTRVPGAHVRSECVYRIPKHSHVEANGDVTLNGSLVAHTEPCAEDPLFEQPLQPGTNPGYTESVSYFPYMSSGDYIKYLDGTWFVPTLPDNGAIFNSTAVFFWNGIASSTYPAIVQPVLEYGEIGPVVYCNPGNCGGTPQFYNTGAHWQLGAWMIVGNNAYMSPFEQVNTYDTIYGLSEVTSQSGSTVSWTISAQDTTSGAFTTLYGSDTAVAWNVALGGVLELGGFTSCSQLPTQSPMVFYPGTYETHYNGVMTAFWSGNQTVGHIDCGWDVVKGGSGGWYLWWTQ